MLKIINEFFNLHRESMLNFRNHEEICECSITSNRLYLIINLLVRNEQNIYFYGEIKVTREKVNSYFLFYI